MAEKGHLFPGSTGWQKEPLAVGTIAPWTHDFY